MGPIELRRPEYTGENRCLPCTVANGAILLVCCLALAALSPLLALAALLAGAGAIRYRGYLVPYTPRLTARVREALADEPARPLPGSLAEADEDVGERTLETLVEAGILVPAGERLHLDEPFRDDWREEMARLRARSDEELVEATAAATEETDVELLDADRPLFALTGSEGGEAWVSRPVVIAEVAAERALAAHVPESSRRDRLVAARALRGFLDRCPDCETPTEETRPHCCGGVRTRTQLEGTVLICPACNEALYRFPDA
ncbi:hypothetical protein [Halalkalicoccus sp. NIPERK01]|uniref:hypothetical protein n=1 Tax=Halalkalicoccus sp. NIPERK01 TaxID=3053469 RepID=UPI00256EC4EB|nr:hypothetical protein [Halalkalicoccus sp. NIPERK01]MDL5361400.1 hypothetical protein [Halalkalicoccus sp. NIPERK01]